MKPKPITLLLCGLIILNSCDPPHLPINSNKVAICGRSVAQSPLYRADLIQNWIKKDPENRGLLTDTKLSICEFTVPDSSGDIRITVHNFPSDKIEERVPPSAQLLRWKRQFHKLDESDETPQSFGGFAGIMLEAKGVMDKKPVSMLGWSMQIAPEHYRAIDNSDKRADYTIKAVGPVEAIHNHRKEIVQFARSFELIDAIPDNR